MPLATYEKGEVVTFSLACPRKEVCVYTVSVQIFHVLLSLFEIQTKPGTIRREAFTALTHNCHLHILEGFPIRTSRLSLYSLVWFFRLDAGSLVTVWWTFGCLKTSPSAP